MNNLLKKNWQLMAPIAITGCLIQAPASLAETRPDPAGRVGTDLIQQERRLGDKARQEKKPVIKEESPPEVIDEGGPEFILKGVRFTRSVYLTREELHALVKPLIGQKVNFARLQELINSINQLYREKNIYTSLAVFPEQTVTDGTVTIRLVEGSVGDVIFSGNEYTPDEYLEQWIDVDDHSESIDIAELERDMLFYNRVHHQRMQAELRAGSNFGLTDIALYLTELPRNTLLVDIDNYGYQSTGEYQISGMYRREALFRTGDRGLTALQVSKGIRSVRLGYNSAVGSGGWRLGGTFQYTDTDINKGDFSTLDVTGNSLGAGLETSYLAYSDEDKWLTLLGSFKSLKSENKVANEGLSDYQTFQYQTGAELNWLGDQWQIGGRLLYSYVDSREQLLGSNRKISMFFPWLNIIYNFESPFYALTTFEGHFSSENELPGAVSFSLGGPSSIRGYSPGVISGDKGWYQQMELHYNGFRYNELVFDLYGFYDHGRVESPGVSQSMGSAGVGLNISGHKWLTLDLLVGSALKTVVPDQDKFRVYAKLTCDCWK